MATVKTFDMAGKNVGTIDLADSVFGITPNKAVMHSMVVNYLANQRQGTQSALTRSEVSGGGQKPYRQKGTGRARQGSTRAVQFTHGGVAFAPKPRDYSYALPKKVRRLAMKSAFSSKVLDEEMIVLEALTMDEIKTKVMAETLKNLNTGKKVLLVLPENNEVLVKSARNIAGVKTALVNTLNVYDILNCNTLVVVKDAVKQIEEVYA